MRNVEKLSKPRIPILNDKWTPTFLNQVLKTFQQARIQTGGVRGVLPTFAGKWWGGFERWGGFFGKIRHNEQN